MGLTGISGTDIFSNSTQQPDQLTSLANTALSRGINLYMKKDYTGAIKEFKRSVGLAPSSLNSIDACNYMAQASLKSNDTKGAINAYKLAIKLDPTRDDTHVSLGNLYMFQKQYQDAQQEYNKAVKLNPSAANRFSLGQAYMYNGRYSDAESQFGMVRRLDPSSPNGDYGLGQNYAKQGLYDAAISSLKKAINLRSDFYDAYSEMGYAYADSGQIDEADKIVDVLQDKDSSLASALSSHIYQVKAPKIAFAYASSSFQYSLPGGTEVSSLNPYLADANASQSFTMVFQFDKQMDRESVENVLNWKIGKSSGSGAGQMYNFGMPVPSTEVQINQYPKYVYYDSQKLTATVQFNIQQNSSGDGTLDPSHVQFTFNGKDQYGVAIDQKHNQFSGFSGVV